MTALIFALLAVFPALVIFAALTDLTSMRIPNWIPGGLGLAFFPAALAVGLPPTTIVVHAGIAMAVLLVGMGLFALRWLGGGDVKLLAAACLWLGLSGSGVFVLWTAVFGGLLAMTLLVAREQIAPFVPSGPGWVNTLMEPKGDIPYGVAIAAGALTTFSSSPLVTVFAGG